MAPVLGGGPTWDRCWHNVSWCWRSSQSSGVISISSRHCHHIPTLNQHWVNATTDFFLISIYTHLKLCLAPSFTIWSGWKFLTFASLRLNMYSYVWILLSKHIDFCLDIDVSLILCPLIIADQWCTCRGLIMRYFPQSFYPTLALRCLGIEVYWFDFSKNSQLFFRIYSGFSGSVCVDRCRVNDVHFGWSHHSLYSLVS